MGIFSDLFSKQNYEAELESLLKAQEILDERFKKKQVSNETYSKKSLEFMKKREKLEKKIEKANK